MDKPEEIKDEVAENTRKWIEWIHKLLLSVFAADRLQPVLEGFEIKVEGHRNKTQTHPDGTSTIVFNPTSVANPFTIIHEFAHAYHNKHWPELTEAVPVERAEAVAHMCEHRLLAAAKHLDFAPELLSNRMNYWAVARSHSRLKDAQDIALRALERLVEDGGGENVPWPDDIHETLEKIMWGEYDGGSIQSQVAGSA